MCIRKKPLALSRFKRKLKYTIIINNNICTKKFLTETKLMLMMLRPQMILQIFIVITKKTLKKYFCFIFESSMFFYELICICMWKKICIISPKPTKNISFFLTKNSCCYKNFYYASQVSCLCMIIFFMCA